jgi:uncharacterized membrane protein
MKNKKGSESNKAINNNAKPKKKITNDSDKSILSMLTQPFLIIFNSTLSLIGFDSFFGVGIMIFLIFILSYSLRVLFTGRGKPMEKRKKTNSTAEVKKDN